MTFSSHLPLGADFFFDAKFPKNPGVITIDFAHSLTRVNMEKWKIKFESSTLATQLDVAVISSKTTPWIDMKRVPKDVELAQFFHSNFVILSLLTFDLTKNWLGHGSSILLAWNKIWNSSEFLSKLKKSWKFEILDFELKSWKSSTRKILWTLWYSIAPFSVISMS